MANPQKQQLGFSEANFSWQQYLDTRPPYPQSLYDLVYAYHEQNNFSAKKWRLAIDIGAGHGVIAEELGKRFNEVAVCEPNAEYLEFARHRLSELQRKQRQGDAAGPVTANYRYFAAPAEEAALPDGTADMLIMGMCIQWTDSSRAIRAAASQLNAGGTLAVIFYRRPFLTNCSPAADALWTQIWNDAVTHMKSTNQMDPMNDRGWRLEDSGLDSVPMSVELFERGARRIKINGRGPQAFEAAPGHGNPAQSMVGTADVCEEVDDQENWTIKDVDSGWLLKALHAYLAGFKLFSKELENEYQQQLDAALSSSGCKADAVHPVSVILGTKRRS